MSQVRIAMPDAGVCHVAPEGPLTYTARPSIPIAMAATLLSETIPLLKPLQNVVTSLLRERSFWCALSERFHRACDLFSLRRPIRLVAAGRL